MCLGEVARVRSVRSDGSVEVDVDGRTAVLSDLLLEHAPVLGDWVLGHAGFALAVLTADEAREALASRPKNTS